ncbi:MAG TPA: MlaD family protein [Gemmataceae bacterium]|nr:MlaD family protein [Gemmataceae bacterium]
MSRSLSRLQAVLLGLVILGGLGLTVGGLFAVGSKYWPWNDTFEVHVGFPQVRGVEIGTRVRVQGIDAGEVVAVRPPVRPGDHVILTLRLAGHWRKQGLIRADATAQIVSEGMVGSKVIEINPGSEAAAPVEENAVLHSQSTPELADALGQVSRLLQTLDQEKGRVGALVDNTNHLIRQGQDTMESIHDVAEAVKRAPLVRNYVEDPQALLVRPNSERNRWIFAEADLFEPGRAQLTAGGRQKLDEIAPRINELKHDGSEVVVVAYADSKINPSYAATLTRQQSEAVLTYLKDRHQVHKMGWLSSRPAKALGLGVKAPPPEPGQDATLPSSRVEVLVFVPQKK